MLAVRKGADFFLMSWCACWLFWKSYNLFLGKMQVLATRPLRSAAGVKKCWGWPNNVVITSLKFMIILSVFLQLSGCVAQNLKTRWYCTNSKPGNTVPIHLLLPVMIIWSFVSIGVAHSEANKYLQNMMHCFKYQLRMIILKKML